VRLRHQFRALTRNEEGADIRRRSQFASCKLSFHRSKNVAVSIPLDRTGARHAV
jgi:hypothetical protein